MFYPRETNRTEGDLVWVGNWGDEERTAELEEFLLGPIDTLGLFANFFGVRYPAASAQTLAAGGIGYHGWLANHHVPEVFARHRVTAHVPRRPYVQILRGIPTIRVFEALACGIPLISAPWDDAERLFPDGCFLLAHDGQGMARHLRDVLGDPALAQSLRANGLKVVNERHSCRHRVQQLLTIYDSLKQAAAAAPKTEAPKCVSSVSDPVLFPPIGTAPRPTIAVS
jgi:spore maturation protein CgeB